MYPLPAPDLKLDAQEACHLLSAGIYSALCETPDDPLPLLGVFFLSFLSSPFFGRGGLSCLLNSGNARIVNNVIK